MVTLKSIYYFIRKMFDGIDTTYLFKSYFFAALVFSFFLFSIFYVSEGSNVSIFFLMFLALSFFLFPFATIAWDDLITTLMSGHVLILPLPIMLIWKLVKIFTLFMFAIFIAPLGIIYIYFAKGHHRKMQ